MTFEQQHHDFYPPPSNFTGMSFNRELMAHFFISFHLILGGMHSIFVSDALRRMLLLVHIISFDFGKHAFI